MDHGLGYFPLLVLLLAVFRLKLVVRVLLNLPFYYFLHVASQCASQNVHA